MNINSLISIINSAFPISTNGTHIGIVTYTSIATTTLSLNNGKSVQSIQQSLTSVTSASSSSHNLLAALVAAQNEMASNSRHQIPGRHRFHRFHDGQSRFHRRPGKRHDVPADDRHANSDFINRQCSRFFRVWLRVPVWSLTCPRHRLPRCGIRTSIYDPYSVQT